MAEMKTRYPVLTEEALAEARKLIGVQLRRRPWVTEATKDAILYFSRGLGSRNPLYQEETYAVNTFYGSLVAHPTFLYCVDDTMVAPKLPGIHSIYAGTDWEFFYPVRIHDKITAKARLIDVVEKNGRFCGRMLLQVGELEYKNQWGKTVAKARSMVMRTSRDAARERGKYAEISRYPYSVEEMEAISSAYDAEHIQGDGVRYWEDINVGKELTPVVKGPLTSEDMGHFIKAVRGVLTFGNAVEHWRRHPADVYWDPEFGMPDSWEASLLKDSVAQEFGFPAAHDTGYQRICWLDNLVTNWMGDMAFLKKLNAKIILPNIYADTTWCKGKVAQKYRQNGGYLAELEVWCENQRGQITAKGSATVSLCSHDPSSLPPLVKL